jgi:broad specificity phosphatase PhoE
MSRLLLVRHAKGANLIDGSYDQLSETGWRQAAELGRHWIAWGITFDRVFVGPRRRHRETAEGVARVFAEAGHAWPDPVELALLDEHAGLAVFGLALPELAETEPDAQAILESIVAGAPVERKVLIRLFKRVMMDWATGRIGHLGQESWSDFRKRAARTLERLTDSESDPGSQVVAVFTSGGLIGAMVAHLLAGSDRLAMQLSFQLRNTAITELRFTGGRVALNRFNALPHLRDPALETMV